MSFKTTCLSLTSLTALVLVLLVGGVGGVRFSLPTSGNDGGNRLQLDQDISLQAIIAVSQIEREEEGRFSFTYMTDELYESAVGFLLVARQLQENKLTITTEFYNQCHISQAYSRWDALTRTLDVVANDGESYLIKKGLRVARPGEVYHAVRAALEAMGGSTEGIEAIFKYIQLELKLSFPKKWILAIFSEASGGNLAKTGPPRSYS
jgi:hypothetical protein